MSRGHSVADPINISACAKCAGSDPMRWSEETAPPRIPTGGGRVAVVFNCALKPKP